MDKKYESRRAEYDARRRQKISEQRQNLKENAAIDPTTRRLYFFDQILKAMGMTQADFAKVTGDSQQKVSWMFSTADDASLSYIQESLLKMNIRITPSIRQRDRGNIIAMNNDMTVVGELPMIGSGVCKAGYMDRCIEQNGRMTFLAEFLKGSGMSAADICKKIPLDPSSLRFLFEHDDTKVSMLLKIAKSFDCTLQWKVEVLDKKI